MSPPASGDARPTSRHAAGGRRAADRGSASDSGRRSGDSSASSAPEAAASGDDLGIAAWLDSAGPAPYETGPLLPGLGDLVDPGRAAEDESGAERPPSKHAAPPPGRSAEPRPSADLGRPGDRGADAGPPSGAGADEVRGSRRSRTTDSTPPAVESRHAADPGAGAGEVRGSRRSRGIDPTPSAAEPRQAAEPGVAGGSGQGRESGRSRSTDSTPPARESRHAADGGGRVRDSGPTPFAGPTSSAAEPGRPSAADGGGRVRDSGPTPFAGDAGRRGEAGAGQTPGSRRSRSTDPAPPAVESRHAADGRELVRDSGPTPFAGDAGRPGEAGAGQSFGSRRSRSTDPTPPAVESRHAAEGRELVRDSGPTPFAGDAGRPGEAGAGQTPGSRRSRSTDSTPPAVESRHAAEGRELVRESGPTPFAGDAGRPGEAGAGQTPGSRRSRGTDSTPPAVESRPAGEGRELVRDSGPTPFAGDAGRPGEAGAGQTPGSRRSRGTDSTPPAVESRHAAEDRELVRDSGPTPFAGDAGRPSTGDAGVLGGSNRAAESGRSRTGRVGEPDRARSAAEAGAEAAGPRASKHAVGRRRRSGPVPTEGAPAAAAGGAPVFGTPFWSGPSQEPDPDDPLGLGEAEGTPDAKRGHRTSHSASAASASSSSSTSAATQAWAPPPPPETATRVARRAPETAGATSAATVAAPPTIHAFAPALAPDPIDEDEDAPAREPSPSGRGGGGTRGRSPGTRPRKTGDAPPPGRATAGALAACLAVAAVLGFAGGAWFGSRDGGADPAGDARTSDPGAPGEGEVPPAEGLTLSADPVEVAPNDLIALAGTLAPVEDGVEVSLQHRVGDGEWVDYPAGRPLTFTTRPDGSFSGSVATDAPGPNFFRVVNVDDAEEVSNEIEITVAE